VLPVCSLNNIREIINGVINFLGGFMTNFKVNVSINQVMEFLLISGRVEKLWWTRTN